MKKIPLLVIAVFGFFVFQKTYSQNMVSASVMKELEDAETKMFKGMTSGDKEYCKNYLSNDFFTINADGVTATKEQTCGDTSRAKLMSQFDYKYFDKKIRVYDNVGIINGRVQVLMKDVVAVEFLYTAIFVKQKGKWMYTSWQGTISKDSPKPPAMPQQ